MPVTICQTCSHYRKDCPFHGMTGCITDEPVEGNCIECIRYCDNLSSRSETGATLG